MILFLQTVTEGPLDTHRKAGDVVLVHFDTFELSIGAQDKKSFAVIKIPDPTLPNGNPYPAGALENIRVSLEKQDFTTGPTPQSNVVLRERAHAIVNFLQRFDATEQEIIKDAN